MKRWFALSATVWCAACTADEGQAAVGDGLTVDVAEVSDVVDAAAPGVSLLGACDRPTELAPAGRVVLAGQWRCAPTIPWNGTVVEDAATWETARAELVACADVRAAEAAVIDPEPVDFATERVVVLGVADGSTCGYTFHRVVSEVGAYAPYVELEVTNRSAGCEIVCAMAGGMFVAVALPRGDGAAPTLCRRVHHGCP